MTNLIDEALFRELNPEEKDQLIEILIKERLEMIELLRYACTQYGDNNWVRAERLGHIFGMHLMRHINYAFERWNGKMRVKE